MSRLRPITEDQLDDAQRATWDAVLGDDRRTAAHRGAVDLRGYDGGLVGPFNAWLHSPNVGRRIVELGGQLRFTTTIDRRLLELAIITVGAHWESNFEFFAHAGYARDAGVDGAVIAALAAGAEPPLVLDDEITVHRICRALLDDHRVDDDLYADGVALLGEAGMTELVALAGFYTLVSFTLNTFRVGLPAGTEPYWPED
jgi:4-carboxymuconolactone decarboxylase